jgi:hypothetical protein
MTMEYMILINSDETAPRPGPGEAGFEEMMGAWLAFNQRLIDGGHWIAGANLQPTTTATTVRKSIGRAPSLIDGPFMETKEQLGGFYLISAPNLDVALAFAREIPVPVASIEVRPVAFRPDAQ